MVSVVEVVIDNKHADVKGRVVSVALVGGELGGLVGLLGIVDYEPPSSDHGGDAVTGCTLLEVLIIVILKQTKELF